MGRIIPQSIETIQHGSELGAVVHGDHLHPSAADDAMAFAEEMDCEYLLVLGTVFCGETGHEYLLVLVEDMSGFVWLESARSCTAGTTARSFIKWCAMMGAPRVWVSDTAALEVFMGRQRRTKFYSGLREGTDEEVVLDRYDPEQVWGDEDMCYEQ